MLPTTSVSKCVKPPLMRKLESRSMEEVVERDNTGTQKSRVRKSRCVIQNCEAKSVKTSTKEWGRLEKKTMYGFKYRNKLGLSCAKLSSAEATSYKLPTS